MRRAAGDHETPPVIATPTPATAAEAIAAATVGGIDAAIAVLGVAGGVIASGLPSAAV